MDRRPSGGFEIRSFRSLERAVGRFNKNRLLAKLFAECKPVVHVYAHDDAPHMSFEFGFLPQERPMHSSSISLKHARFD